MKVLLVLLVLCSGLAWSEGRVGGKHGKGQKMARFDVNHDGVLDAGERSAAIDALLANPKVRERMAKRHGGQVDEVALRARLEKRMAKWQANPQQGGP